VRAKPSFDWTWQKSDLNDAGLSAIGQALSELLSFLALHVERDRAISPNVIKLNVECDASDHRFTFRASTTASMSFFDAAFALRSELRLPSRPAFCAWTNSA
jgi:hypothetical protein